MEEERRSRKAGRVCEKAANNKDATHRGKVRVGRRANVPYRPTANTREFTMDAKGRLVTGFLPAAA